MTTLTLIELLGCSLFGALLPDAIRIAKNRDSMDIPEFLKHPNFWLSLAVLIIISIGANLLANPKSALEAIAFAYGAPEFLTKLLSSGPGGPPPPSSGGSRIGADIILPKSAKDKRLRVTGDVKIDTEKFDADFLTFKDADVKVAKIPSIREWWGS